MKKNYLGYITALFFLSLFLFRGIATVMPMLGTDNEHIVKNKFTAGSEPGESNKTTEGKVEQEGKEVYINHSSLLQTITDDLFVLLTTLERHNDPFKNIVFLSIPTPPPQQGRLI